ncbi:MATE family efflux transporter [Leucothrix mucor]|uniref:MATE family efflux transporter n=1 Tax=Leucothrix mucor TaxID=45248 RepID=UPI0003B55B49|nr:MATE family efflux transporter [Leucothrix mucor]
MHILKNLDRPTLSHIASVAWPMALNAILMESVIIVDLLLVASLGDVSVAAFGIGSALIAFVISIQFAIGNGTQLVLSRAVGTEDINKIGLETACGWILSIGFSLAAVIALWFGADALIHLITHDDRVAVLAASYVKISLLMLLASSLTKIVVSYFNAYKRTRIPLYGFLLEIPVNVLCSAALIHGLWGAPELGLAGAAWGSVIAIVLRLIYLAYQFKREVIQGYVAGFMRVDRSSLCAHFDEVMPMTLNFIVLFTGMLVFQALFAQLPVSSFAAITLILPWIKVGSLFVNSWTQSSTILVSQKLGKKDYITIPNLVQQTKFVSVLMCIVMVIGFYLFSLAIPHLYSNLSADTILALALIAPIYVLIPIFRVNNMFCGNMIRAMGESYIIVRINLITQWLIAIPTCILLVYLRAPLPLVFGVILLDEILKFYPFRKTLMRKLASYAG